MPSILGKIRSIARQAVARMVLTGRTLSGKIFTSRVGREELISRGLGYKLREYLRDVTFFGDWFSRTGLPSLTRKGAFPPVNSIIRAATLRKTKYDYIFRTERSRGFFRRKNYQYITVRSNNLLNNDVSLELAEAIHTRGVSGDPDEYSNLTLVQVREYKK